MANARGIPLLTLLLFVKMGTGKVPPTGSESFWKFVSVSLIIEPFISLCRDSIQYAWHPGPIPLSVIDVIAPEYDLMVRRIFGRISSGTLNGHRLPTFFKLNFRLRIRYSRPLRTCGSICSGVLLLLILVVLIFFLLQL